MQTLLREEDKTKTHEKNLPRRCKAKGQKASREDKSPRRTERPIETARAVHILAVLARLLFAHTVDIVSRDLGVFGRPEPGESHALSHHRLHLILVGVFLEIHVHFLRVTTSTGRTVCGSSIFSRVWVFAIRPAVTFIAS